MRARSSCEFGLAVGVVQKSRFHSLSERNEVNGIGRNRNLRGNADFVGSIQVLAFRPIALQ
jgi:hypothetical protein